MVASVPGTCLLAELGGWRSCGTCCGTPDTCGHGTPDTCGHGTPDTCGYGTPDTCACCFLQNDHREQEDLKIRR